jgi:hypothetical protein
MNLWLILGYAPSVLCGIHALRSGRAQQWLWILAVAPGVGPAMYFFSVMLPDFMGTGAARRLGKAAQKALDPQKEYREAREALRDADTVGNHMRMAQAAQDLGKWDEAEAEWRVCVSGPFKEDAVVILGHVRALIELMRHEKALNRLDAFRASGAKKAQSGACALLYARALEGLGRYKEADAPYRHAADHTAGLEAAGRYCACLAKAGKHEEAELALAEIERRLPKIQPVLRAQEQRWRDLTAAAVAAMKGAAPA